MHKMTLGQLIKRDWMDYSLLACLLAKLFLLWTNETFAQHLLVIGCGVLHIFTVVDIVLLKTWLQSVNNSAVSLTNRGNKNTTTYCTKLPQHAPRTYYMSTTNGKMDQRWEHVHDAEKQWVLTSSPEQLSGRMQQVLRERKHFVWFQTRRTRQTVCVLEVHMEHDHHASALNFVQNVQTPPSKVNDMVSCIALVSRRTRKQISAVKFERLIMWQRAKAFIQSASNARVVA